MNVNGGVEALRVEQHGGGAMDSSDAVKAVVGAITETVIVGSTTSYTIAKSLSIAYAALFLTILLFLAVLLILLCLHRHTGGGGGGGGGAAKFAKRAAMAVVFLVPLLALAAQTYTALLSKANVNNK